MTRTVPPAKGLLLAVSPKGSTLRFQFDPAQLIPSGGVGGWTEVPAARELTAIEFTGTPPVNLPIPLWFDGYADNTSVEPQLQQLWAWGQPTADGQEPPVLQLKYAGWDSYRWVINDLTWGAEIRRSDAQRVQANITVILLEHRALGDKPGTADSVRRNAYAPGSLSSTAAKAPTYTVRAGDTLSAIAAKQLGKASRWKDIASLNGIRDPAKIKPGQKLKLPAS